MEDGLRPAPAVGGGRLLAPVTGPEDFAKAFDVSRETIVKLTRYAEMLREWQSRANLVASSTVAQVWDRHFADSAQLLPLAPEAKVWLDLGSGAGFPGLVVAILRANHARFEMHLVESTAKKCAFLAEVARVTEAPVEIHCMRVEELARGGTSWKPEIVTARALLPLPRLLQLAAPWLGRRARGLFLKGRGLDQELAESERRFRFKAQLHPSLTAGDSAIVEVSDLRKRGKDVRG